LWVFSNISFNFHGRMWQILKKKKMATHTKVYKMSQYVSWYVSSLV